MQLQQLSNRSNKAVKVDSKPAKETKGRLLLQELRKAFPER